MADQKLTAINIVMENTAPADKTETFMLVEIENDEGKSVEVGTWGQRPDGLWSLRIEGDFKR